MYSLSAISAARPRVEPHLWSGEGLDVLARVKCLVLLGGSLTPSPLQGAIQRSVLDLPLESSRSLLDWWQEQAAHFARGVGLRSLPVRLVLDRWSPEPSLPVPALEAAMQVDRDPFEYRGTAGILRDLAEDYAPGDFLLVASAAQLLVEPLGKLAMDLSDLGADVSVVSHADGTPCGLMLVQCGSLRHIAPVGFVDMKEQALPLIARHQRVRVVRRQQPSGLPLRTASDYIRILKTHHRPSSLRASSGDPFAEDWTSTFVVVEEGASVDRSAEIFDSVVLRGGTVEGGSVLVRSLVCPGAVVQRRSLVVDACVPPGGSGRPVRRAR